MRPLLSVFLRLVPRLSVYVNTVIRLKLPRPLAADDDLSSLVHLRSLAKD